MVRCTIEIIPFGNEEQKRVIGVVEIANDASGNHKIGNYKIILKKTPPWKGALVDTWKKAFCKKLKDDEEIMIGEIIGFDRLKRGPYDLLFKALKACGIDKRNK